MFSTPTRRPSKRTISKSNICNSSDTEDFRTPPRKRHRLDGPSSDGLDSSPASGSSSVSISPSKRKSSRRKFTPVAELELASALRRCSSLAVELATIKEVKTFPRGEMDGLRVVQELLRQTKASVKSRLDANEDKILEIELYLEWLQDLNFVVLGVENLLGAKVAGTRKRVSGLGRISFTILYQLVDEFISEVDSHHDGWSYRSPESESRGSSYPATMTIIEESHDTTADFRTEEAVRGAEECLLRYDAVMADAVRRYKIECGRNNVKLADGIGSKEHALARACCLLCEQTGYGSDDNDMGDTLLQETRFAMREWKREFGSEDSREVEDSDELTSD